ncbi:hypothetical protein [Streptomyces sp. CT34]|uniref:hypothetical protein n=1 Tax=Streptomyces sp. CT34 TaxID=1553907 RepID=UPI0012FF29DA|nr:hypothetical protein [Streptomyces sp. CT34]
MDGAGGLPRLTDPAHEQRGTLGLRRDLLGRNVHIDRVNEHREGCIGNRQRRPPGLVRHVLQNLDQEVLAHEGVASPAADLIPKAPYFSGLISSSTTHRATPRYSAPGR